MSKEPFFLFLGTWLKSLSEQTVTPTTRLRGWTATILTLRIQSDRPEQSRYCSDAVLCSLNTHQQVVKWACSNLKRSYGVCKVNSLGAKFHITFVVCFVWFFFNKLSIGKKFICKAERLNFKQCRSWRDGSLWANERSHLDLHCLQKPIIIAYGSERVKA